MFKNINDETIQSIVSEADIVCGGYSFDVIKSTEPIFLRATQIKYPYKVAVISFEGELIETDMEQEDFEKMVKAYKGLVYELYKIALEARRG